MISITSLRTRYMPIPGAFRIPIEAVLPLVVAAAGFEVVELPVATVDEVANTAEPVFEAASLLLVELATVVGSGIL
jgi:hypothetical protein